MWLKFMNQNSTVARLIPACPTSKKLKEQTAHFPMLRFMRNDTTYTFLNELDLSIQD
jgi:hypothetical protein